MTLFRPSNQNVENKKRIKDANYYIASIRWSRYFQNTSTLPFRNTCRNDLFRFFYFKRHLFSII